MSRPLPNLNQLRAFEAAARHLSFKLAAEELHVTQELGLSDFHNADVAVRNGRGGWPGISERLLHRDILCPVCAPSLAAGQLIHLHPLTVAGINGIFLVHQKTSFPIPRLVAFGDWLKSEAEAMAISELRHEH